MRWCFRILSRREAFIRCRRSLVAAAAVVLGLLVCPGVGAATPTDTLRDVFAEANRVLVDPATEDRPTERLVAVRKLLHALFEFRGAAELALGPEWQARTSTEQDEFVRLFADLLELSYVYRVASVARAQAGVRVRYLGEEVDRDTAMVRTGLASRDGSEVILDYEMVQRADRWMVRDVLIEGISLVGNYRAQFQRIIRNSSYPRLVARMKATTVEWSRVLMGATEVAANRNGTTPPRAARIRDNSPSVQSARTVQVDHYAATVPLGLYLILGRAGEAP